MKIKKILISQPDPGEKSPYTDLVNSHGIKIDFKPFIQLEGLSAKEFRAQRVDILTHTAIIFTARTAIDHFFRLCEEMRIAIPETMKYFCMSESIALYLQKYIVYRKRKIFFGTGSNDKLVELLSGKHKDEKYLLALADSYKPDLPKALDKLKLNYTKAVFYRTVYSDMKEMDLANYDMIAFFSPAEIKSLQSNFPEFHQNGTVIATFGPATAKAVKAAKLRIDIEAPSKETPSMSMAIDSYLKKNK